MHINYVLNEYESMLVAAGWVDAGDLDSDYLDYVAKDDEPMSYQQWLNCRESWNELNAAYETEIDPLYKDVNHYITSAESKRAKELLDQMTYLEVLLGY